MHTIRISTLAAVVLTALMTAACSEGVQRLSPASPTPTAAASGSGSEVSSTSGGTMDHTLGAIVDPAVVAAWAARAGWDALDGLVVEGSDVITAVSGVCPTVTITVRSVPVVVNAATQFTGAATCAGLTVGRTVRVRGLLTSTATGLLVTATNIGFEGPPPPPTEVEVSGVVASFTGPCPTLTITLRGTGAVVVTSATTRFEPACASVAVGEEIEAEGTRNATGQLVATKVSVRDDEGRRGRPPVNGEGEVGNITGTCPTVTMTIRGYRVSTTPTTIFVNGVCSDLRPGMKVEITGETQADGGVVATRVEIRRTPGRPVRGDGTVSRVTGTCPSVTMMVQGYAVMTTATTIFTGGTCASIRPGVKVDVTGTESGGVITATAVAIESPGRRDP